MSFVLCECFWRPRIDYQFGKVVVMVMVMVRRDLAAAEVGISAAVGLVGSMELLLLAAADRIQRKRDMNGTAAAVRFEKSGGED